MFFCHADGRAYLAGAPDAHAILRLSPPLAEINGAELAFDVARTDAARGAAEYAAPGLAARDSVRDAGGGLFAVERTVENVGAGTRTLKLILEAEGQFVPLTHTIPCVSYDGNRASGGREPRGTALDGQPWIFAYDRVGIPSCTISEDATRVAALFASDRDEASLRTACSFAETPDGRLRHRIYYPVTEAPLTYSDHDVMTERYDEYLTLRPGERFTALAHVFVGAPKWLHYGTASVLDRALDAFPFRHGAALAPEAVYAASLANSRFLMADYHGARMFLNAQRNHPRNGHIYFPDPIGGAKHPGTAGWGHIEPGWSGQSFQQARHFIREFRRTGERAWLDDALGCLDAWVATQWPSGLFPTNYVRHVANEPLPGDVCNFGWAAAEAVKSFRLLKGLGIERPAYLDFAVRLGDFFVEHYDEEDGFGLKWSPEGEKVESGGTIGGFMVMALLELHRETGAAKYLDTARRAMDLYVTRDLDRFLCLAGALDCSCIDKETAWPLLLCALDLHATTGEAGYLETARKAAYYFFSWAFHYDALYPPDSDFARLGYYTAGGTAVSTQHQAIDPWGALAVPEFFELARRTGDEGWRRRAVMLWRNAILGMAPPEGLTLHGHHRPHGVQSEAFFQARWTRYRDTCEERGHLHDMYVGWPAAFRLSTLEKMHGQWDQLR